MPARTLEFEGCVNFRDLGGYPAADGRRVAWRRLFRADGLGGLSDADRTAARQLGLATVVDLRTAEESERRGRFPVEDVPVRYHAFPLLDVMPSAEEAPRWTEPGYVTGRYLGMVRDGATELAGAVRALAEPDALPAVFHCSAGKDRSGVLAALVLAFVGVPDAVIVEDYALSEAAMGALLERIKADYPDAVDAVEQYAPTVLHVAPETMEDFLRSLRDEHGGYEALAASLGLTDAVTRLRAGLLVDG